MNIQEPFFILIFYLDKTWTEHVEYILDTLDYLQLHQEELHDFYQLANNLLLLLNEKQIVFETIKDGDLRNFHEEIEKLSEQIELLNQKGELLLQSSTTDSNDNPVERLLEEINRNYDSIIMRMRISSDQIDQTHQNTAITSNEVSKLDCRELEKKRISCICLDATDLTKTIYRCTASPN